MQKNLAIANPDLIRRIGPPQLLRVTDRVYCATGYAISNVLFVITGASVVVVDTTESMAAARASFEEFRKVCSAPVSHILYTHFHGDHIRGAKVFHSLSTQVIAHKRLPEEVEYITRMLPYRKRVTALQFGFHLKPGHRAVTLLNEPESGYVSPDILVDDQYQFQQGDLTFELYHTEGETLDHLMVWIPEERALLPGDLYYSTFPMLSSPMRPDRPVLQWAESLQRMRAFRPQHLVPSHSKPLSGEEEIDLVLANYSRAIRYVHDETVNRINQGLPLEEIRSQVTLPRELASLPYLEERYGKVAWAVNGVFRQNTGWFSFNASDLNPGPRAAFQRALVVAAGGPHPFVERARRALREGENQLVLELTDVILGARPRNEAARSLRIKALKRMGKASQNGVEQNIYRSAARMERFARKRIAESRDLGYSGRWLRPTPKAASKSDASRRSVEARKGRRLAQRTAVLVNQWYDRRVYSGAARERYEGSDFHNFGYWTAGTRKPSQACENLMEVLLAFIESKTGTILDIGYGKGATTRYLLKYYDSQNVTGINISEKQLRTRRANPPQRNFVAMKATSLGFGNCSFDNAICVEAAHHFVTKAKFLEEAYRVLKPGGRLVLSDLLLPAKAGQNPSPIAPMGTVVAPEKYRDLYFAAGFVQLDIVDATEECLIGFQRHSLRVLRDKAQRAEIDWQTVRRREARIKSNIGNCGYYLLVCANKMTV